MAQRVPGAGTGPEPGRLGSVACALPAPGTGSGKGGNCHLDQLGDKRGQSRGTEGPGPPQI